MKKIKPRINIRGKSIYHRRKIGKRYDPYRDTGRQAVSFQLDEVLSLLKKNPELEKRIIEARKLGVQTLIDKLLQVFNYQEVESPNEILWIREKTKFVQWIAGKITDLYSDNKTIKQDIDTKMSISWEEPNDLIDVSAEDVPAPTERD